MEGNEVRLDADAARRILLARAIDEADPAGRLLGAPEREEIETAAAAAARGSGGVLDPVRYLRERAARVLARIEPRNPRLAALQQGDPWRRLLAWGLPLAAILVGAALDRIENPQHVNMLSPPLLAVLFWNLLVYLVLLAGLFFPRRTAQGPAWARWLAARADGGGARANVRSRFAWLWLQATRREQVLGWQQLMHGTAAGWAIGLALSIVIGGLVRQYRVGWESTLLDLDQVHAFLRLLFAPVVALLPFDAFSAADLQRLHFGSGQELAREEARRWVGMYLALLALVVVLPRLLLALLVAWRRRLASEVVLRLDDPYFAPLLARVSPARVVLGLPPGAPSERWLRVWRGLAREAGTPHPGEPWTVLSTPQGDRLQVLLPTAAQWQAGAAGTGPAPASTEEREVPGAAAWWRRWRGPSPLRPREAAAALAVDAWLEASPDPGRPAVAWSATLDEEEAADSWIADADLQQRLRGRLPPPRQAAFDRLAAAWTQRNEERFVQAMQLLAALLARAAADSEDVPAGSWLRGLVQAAEREAQQRARQQAFATLLQRLAGEESALLADLHQLHGLPAPATPVALGRPADLPALQEPGAAGRKAGLAGAAGGAAMGAGIDLATGGLTLGAATALGALLGGGASFAATLWRQREAAGGRTQLQLGDDTLQTLAEGVLLHYLRVAVGSRHGEPPQVPPADWRSAAVVAVEARRAALQSAWQPARSGDRAAAEEALAPELQGLARGLLAAIRRPRAAAPPPPAASPPPGAPPVS